jgi:CRISPR-associated protein Csc3
MIDPKHLALLVGTVTPESTTVFREYLDQVANGRLFEYQEVIQYGGKMGQTLYTHILSGIFLLEQLRGLLALSDIEARVLFTAYTLHDLNKLPDMDGSLSFGKLATAEEIEKKLLHLGLDEFLPDYLSYLVDIEHLVRDHSGHSNHGMGGLFGGYRAGFGLDEGRVLHVLVPLIRAVDTADLLHSLDDKPAKQVEFLFNLNHASDGVQYELVSHRLDEQRGILSNVLHNAMVSELEGQLGLLPLLFFPAGVAYLVPRGQLVEMQDGLLEQIGRRAAQSVAQMVGSNFRNFIQRRPAGMKVDPKCLQLGIPFAGRDGILNEMYRILQRASFDVEGTAKKVAQRTRRAWKALAAAAPEVAAEVEPLLERPRDLIAKTQERLRLGELIRSYYLFLKEHLGQVVPDPWPHLYEMLELAPERYAFYDFFGDRYDRAYVLMRDVKLSEEQIYQRIEADGKGFLPPNVGGDKGGAEASDPNTDLLTNYLRRYASFSFALPSREAYTASLEHYVTHQHKQCVNCAAPFMTSDWMSADVRSDVTVQAFSNRLRGGPGEPKKQVCEVCHLQFLLEKLNYPEVRGEKTLYLHLYPYSFLTKPFLRGLRTSIQNILDVEPDVRALHLNGSVAALKRLAKRKPVQIDFSSRTKKNKSHPYGLYLPHFSQSIGNLLVFPINPAGGNDSARFLFAFQYALLLQRHFGMKVLLSDAPISPLRQEDFGDLYVDSIPLSMRGFLRENDYQYWIDGKNKQYGTLAALWQTIGHLIVIRNAVYNPSSKRDELLTLVKALANSPLGLFYSVEKLLEQRVRDDKKATAKEWLLIRQSQLIFDEVKALALQIGGKKMSKLSEHLQYLANVAWEERLRGRSREKNSLMAPVDEIFKKINQRSDAFDEEALRALIAEDMMEHIVRATEAKYRPGFEKQMLKIDTCRAFVDYFFDNVVHDVYRGKMPRLLADEKALRSAFLFYIRQEIPRKEANGDAAKA